MHKSTYEYLEPTAAQKAQMADLRTAAKVYSDALVGLPDGPDKTHTLRLHRTTAMWANVALAAQPDGTPR